jgi:hypothetical protein
VTVSSATATTATLTWTATGAPSYAIWQLQSGSYGQVFSPILTGYTDVTYAAYIGNIGCRQFRVQAEPFVGTAPTVTACVLDPPFLQGSSYNLPDPHVVVNLSVPGKTTVTIYHRNIDGTGVGKTYTGNANFIYSSECSKPDSASYRCDIMTETGEVLVAADGSTLTADITAQFYANLIISGHNYWRQGQTVLSGLVTST